MNAKRIALLCLWIAGCGSSGTANNPATVSQLVTAAAGGTVTVGSTGASLAIPAHSLTADTTITATATAPPASLPMASTLQGMYYDFGPSGTQFSPAASLTLPLAASPAAGMSAVISFYDGTQWNDLATTAANGTVTASVAHFTGFIVRFVTTGTGKAVDCSAAKTPCGGTLLGTWKPSTICPPQTAVPPNCPSSTAEFSDALSGSAVFNMDGTYTANLPYTETFTGHFSAACLTANMIANCADLQATLRNAGVHSSLLMATCSSNTSMGCDCTGTGMDAITTNESGSYTVSGSTYTSTKSGGGAESPVGYCVDGTTLWVQESTDPVEYLVFTR